MSAEPLSNRPVRPEYRVPSPQSLSFPLTRCSLLAMLLATAMHRDNCRRAPRHTPPWRLASLRSSGRSLSRTSTSRPTRSCSIDGPFNDPLQATENKITSEHRSTIDPATVLPSVTSSINDPIPMGHYEMPLGQPIVTQPLRWLTAPRFDPSIVTTHKSLKKITLLPFHDHRSRNQLKFKGLQT